MIPVIAIYDIGKTNKKFFLLDEAYKIVLERSASFEEITDEDGDPCDDVERISNWVTETLSEVMQLRKFDIRAINFSAYGASFVYVSDEGKVVAPLYNYLKKYPETLKNELYNKYGGAEKVSCETASPVLGSLNSGMQLYRIKKEKPALYDQIQFALHLPQYISYLITKHPCSDITSIGCHTQLWDFQKNDYHQWVKDTGIDKKLAPVHSVDKAVEIVIGNKKVAVGTGLHDSSAALIPYLAAFTEPFILLSTGTWCISLNPFNDAPLTNEELTKDCLCYMGYNGKPVKAARLFAGYEHEQQTKRLAQHFDKSADYYKRVKYAPSIITGLKKRFVFAEDSSIAASMVQQSNFGNRDLSLFKNYNEAYHCLLLDIMRQQQDSTQLIIQQSGVKRIFVDGGFSNNSIYMHLLAQAFPQLEVYAASVAQATAMGAALAIHQQWNSGPVPADMVKLEFYKVSEVLV
ncbi:MAG TPA: FGGY family carbohydrate kinase [Chitinophagaceae bacterium]